MKRKTDLVTTPRAAQLTDHPRLLTSIQVMDEQLSSAITCYAGAVGEQMARSITQILVQGLVAVLSLDPRLTLAQHLPPLRSGR
jgi:hypothetical protein